MDFLIGDCSNLFCCSDDFIFHLEKRRSARSDCWCTVWNDCNGDCYNMLAKCTDSIGKEHEVKVKLFDERTTAYKNLLKSLKEILKDGKVTTLKDAMLNNQEDEFQEILFNLTELSSFIQNQRTKFENKNAMDSLVDATAELIKNAQSLQIDKEEMGKWTEDDLKRKQEKYYSQIAVSLQKINEFARKYIQQPQANSDGLDLSPIIKNTELFKIDVIKENEQTENVQQEQDIRVNAVVQMLHSIKELLKEYSYNKKEPEKSGDAGDGWWGWWVTDDPKDGLDEKTIAAWMLEKNRRKTLGYKTKIADGLSMSLEIWGGGYCVTQYFVADTDDIKNKVAAKMEDIKIKFAEGWGTWWNVQDYGIFLSRDLNFNGFNFHDEYDDDYGKNAIAQIKKLNDEWKDEIKKSIDAVRKQLD